MIAFLRGRLIAKTPNRAIVECGGVGYDATISVATFTALPAEGAEARLHIYTHVREDQIALFGFAEAKEKKLFEKLLTISGIGPKLAENMMGRTFCPLGDAAAMPTLGFVKKFRKEFEDYIEGKKAGTPVMTTEHDLVGAGH